MRCVLLLILIVPKIVFAQDMKFIGYTETKDCEYPSTWTCVPDVHSQCTYTIKQDPRCENDKPIASYVRSEA